MKKAFGRPIVGDNHHGRKSANPKPGIWGPRTKGGVVGPGRPTTATTLAPSPAPTVADTCVCPHGTPIDTANVGTHKFALQMGLPSVKFPGGTAQPCKNNPVSCYFNKTKTAGSTCDNGYVWTAWNPGYDNSSTGTTSFGMGTTKIQDVTINPIMGTQGLSWISASGLKGSQKKALVSEIPHQFGSGYCIDLWCTLCPYSMLRNKYGTSPDAEGYYPGLALLIDPSKMSNYNSFGATCTQNVYSPTYLKRTDYRTNTGCGNVALPNGQNPTAGQVIQTSIYSKIYSTASTAVLADTGNQAVYTLSYVGSKDQCFWGDAMYTACSEFFDQNMIDNSAITRSCWANVLDADQSKWNDGGVTAGGEAATDNGGNSAYCSHAELMGRTCKTMIDRITWTLCLPPYETPIQWPLTPAYPSGAPCDDSGTTPCWPPL